MTYSKTQYGKLLIGFTAVFIILTLVFFNKLKEYDPTADIPVMLALVLFLLFLLNFYRLKVEVYHQEISVSFGIGLIKKKININDIESVDAVRNSFWYGWGIRLTPHGWLWNISGYEAVELSFKKNENLELVVLMEQP